jgi:hypothetical protein
MDWIAEGLGGRGRGQAGDALGGVWWYGLWVCGMGMGCGWVMGNGWPVVLMMGWMMGPVEEKALIGTGLRLECSVQQRAGWGACQRA